MVGSIGAAGAAGAGDGRVLRQRAAWAQFPHYGSPTGAILPLGGQMRQSAASPEWRRLLGWRIREPRELSPSWAIPAAASLPQRPSSIFSSELLSFLQPASPLLSPRFWLLSFPDLTAAVFGLAALVFGAAAALRFAGFFAGADSS